MVKSKHKRKAKGKRDNNDATMEAHPCIWGAARCTGVWIFGVVNELNVTV